LTFSVYGLLGTLNTEPIFLLLCGLCKCKCRLAGFGTVGRTVTRSGPSNVSTRSSALSHARRIAPSGPIFEPVSQQLDYTRLPFPDVALAAPTVFLEHTPRFSRVTSASAKYSTAYCFPTPWARGCPSGSL
jgi:hypothetical protein